MHGQGHVCSELSESILRWSQFILRRSQSILRRSQSILRRSQSLYWDGASLYWDGASLYWDRARLYWDRASLYWDGARWGESAATEPCMPIGNTRQSNRTVRSSLQAHRVKLGWWGQAGIIHQTHRYDKRRGAVLVADLTFTHALIIGHV